MMLMPARGNVPATRRIQLDLRALGVTSRQVAYNLHRAGVEGHSHPNGCPIAEYLKKLGYRRVDVTTNSIRYHDATGVTKIVRPPRAVRKFIHQFDNGHYQHLHR